uniref:Uncharacterized protein n=1 Tax=Eutreptiella gymnastica TaxID=73025 RepID=A0A7S1ISF7_9EUGL
MIAPSPEHPLHTSHIVQLLCSQPAMMWSGCIMVCCSATRGAPAGKGYDRMEIQGWVFCQRSWRAIARCVLIKIWLEWKLGLQRRKINCHSLLAIPPALTLISQHLGA